MFLSFYLNSSVFFPNRLKFLSRYLWQLRFLVFLLPNFFFTCLGFLGHPTEFVRCMSNIFKVFLFSLSFPVSLLIPEGRNMYFMSPREKSNNFDDFFYRKTKKGLKGNQRLLKLYNVYKLSQHIKCLSLVPKILGLGTGTGVTITKPVFLLIWWSFTVTKFNGLITGSRSRL